MDVFKDVGEFHAKFELPVAGHTRMAPLRHADLKWRVAAMNEELREFIEAHTNNDLAGCADALADLIWFAAGTAHYLGVPLDLVWTEVRRANMEKRPWREGDPIKPRNVMVNTAGEIVKPDGWRPPDVFGIITAWAEKLRGRMRA